MRAEGEPNDNGYAHPLDGVIAIVDVNKMQGEKGEAGGVRREVNNFLIFLLPFFLFSFSLSQLLQWKSTNQA